MFESLSMSLLVFLIRFLEDSAFVRKVPEVAVFGINLCLADAVGQDLVSAA